MGTLALPKVHDSVVTAARDGLRLGHLVAVAPMEKPSAKPVVRAKGILGCGDPQGSSVSLFLVLVYKPL